MTSSLAGISQGSKTALGDLYDLVGSAVWKTCFALTADPTTAERATIATFTQAWKTPDELPRSPSGALRWLLAAASDFARDGSNAKSWVCLEATHDADVYRYN